MNPKFHYLIELAKLIGRLGYALDANDTHAFVGILRMIATTTEKAIEATRPRMQMRILDLPPGFEDDDDEL